VRECRTPGSVQGASDNRWLYCDELNTKKGRCNMTSSDSSIVFDELLTSDRYLVFWGFFWRGLLTTIASAVGGAIAGFILGFILGLLGHALSWPADSIRTGASILGVVVGLVVGLICYWQYIRWMFRAKMSGYQLKLVSIK
jgi:ABC-type amino acid transport system permease subunit